MKPFKRAETHSMVMADVTLESRLEANRSLGEPLAIIEKLCEKLRLPSSAREEAARIYGEALKRGLVKGWPKAAMAAAALYAACRKMGVPVKLNLVVKTLVIACGWKPKVKAKSEWAIIQATRRAVGKCYRLLVRELGLPVKPMSPEACVRWVAERVGLGDDVREMAETILRKIREVGRSRAVVGKDPLGLAVTAIYIACAALGVQKTQMELTFATGVAEVTIGSHCRELREKLGIRIPFHFCLLYTSPSPRDRG